MTGLLKVSKIRIPLLQQFGLVGLIATLALASGFSWLGSRWLIEVGRERLIKNTEGIASVLIAPKLERLARLEQVSRTEWETLERQVLGRMGFVQLKVWNTEGQVLHSNISGLIGQFSEIEDDLRQALQGNTSASITYAPSSGQQKRKLYEIYVPVFRPGTAQVLGVVEFYHDFEPLQQSITQIQTGVWGAFGLGFGLLFLTLFTLMRSASVRLQHYAYHDPLTGLANRRLLRKKVNRALIRSHRSRSQLALIYMDLDRFKEVNDTLGHSAGDALLEMTAHRLNREVREGDSLFRLGGDEFALLLEESSQEQVERCIKRLLTSFDEAFSLGGQVLHIKCSMGIAMYPKDGETLEVLMRAADIAMYQAKSSGLGYAHYDPDLDIYSLERLECIEKLRTALQEQSFLLHYQPIQTLGSGAVQKVEALVRWQPEGKFASPAEFIPLLEEAGHIRDLDAFVLHRALKEAKALDLEVSINLSASSLGDPDLVGRVTAALTKSGFPPERLWVEVTETSLMQNMKFAVSNLATLRAIGVGVALDDFGKGYSSLAYLKRLPVDLLKIDREFVRGIGNDARDEEIIQSVITLAHGLGLEVLAEGVETEGQLRWLEDAGCDFAQGYAISRPVPLERLMEDLLEVSAA